MSLFKKGSAAAAAVIDENTKEEAVEASAKEKKKNASKATKGKIKEATKKAAQKLLLDMTQDMPSGQPKEFLTITNTLLKLDEQAKVIATAKKSQRAKLKAMKIHLRCYDPIYRMLKDKWTEADIEMFDANQAIYREQLGLALAGHQKAAVEQLKAKHAATKKAVLEANGGETGKEIGSGVPARADISPESVAIASAAHH